MLELQNFCIIYEWHASLREGKEDRINVSLKDQKNPALQRDSLVSAAGLELHLTDETRRMQPIVYDKICARHTPADLAGSFPY